MAIPRKIEDRALDKGERELVEKSHHPAVRHVSDAELAKLATLVRERRDRARVQAAQHRREMRGKADPRGAAPSRSEEGSKLKAEVLAMAMRRLNNEAGRRRRMAAKVAHVESARRALAMKRDSEPTGPEFNSRLAHEGMRAAPNLRNPSLIRPMERGRVRKATAVAQARRDNR